MDNDHLNIYRDKSSDNLFAKLGGSEPEDLTFSSDGVERDQVVVASIPLTPKESSAVKLILAMGELIERRVFQKIIMAIFKAGQQVGRNDMREKVRKSIRS